MSNRTVRKGYAGLFWDAAQTAIAAAVSNSINDAHNQTDVPDLSRHPKSLPEARIALAEAQKRFESNAIWHHRRDAREREWSDSVIDLNEKVKALEYELDQTKSSLSDANATASMYRNDRDSIKATFAGYQQAMQAVIDAGKST